MYKRIILLLVPALQACSAFGIDDNWSKFRVELGGSGTRGTPGGDRVRINNSPFDARGMAGIEVEITGIDGLPPTLTLTAADFQESPSREWEFRLPDSGPVGFAVRLRDGGGRLVAEEMSGEFPIEPGSSWILELDRSPFTGDDIQNPPCPDPWGTCYGEWVSEIREDARSYSSEVLWVVLYRRSSEPCPKDVLCM